MGRGLLFWILMILWFLSVVGLPLVPAAAQPYGAFVSTLLLFVLFALLGWDVYGPALRGK